MSTLLNERLISCPPYAPTNGLKVSVRGSCRSVRVLVTGLTYNRRCLIVGYHRSGQEINVGDDNCRMGVCPSSLAVALAAYSRSNFAPSAKSNRTIDGAHANALAVLCSLKLLQFRQFACYRQANPARQLCTTQSPRLNSRGCSRGT